MSARRRRAKKARARRRRRIASRPVAVSGGLAVALAAPATPAAGAETTLVKDINPGSPSSNLSDPTIVGGTLYFQADDASNGIELWKSDGTAAGTSLVKDIRPGAANSYPANLTNVGGTLFFAANDGTTGSELWKAAKDTTPPDTTIDSGPAEGAKITTTSATFAFHGTAGDTASLECKLDGGAFSACSSPHTFSGLADGTHTVAFRAIDASSNADPSPATRTFKVAAAAFELPKKGKANKKKGTLALKVKLPGPGELEAKGKLIKPAKVEVKKAGKTKITLKPAKKGKVKLNKKGKLKAKAKFTFIPDGGSPHTESGSYTLKKK